MATKWPPPKDADLNSLATNASTKISLAPTSYGLDTGKATALASAVSAWSAAYAVTLDPTTRTKSSISIKDDKRSALTQILRDYNKIVQGNPTVSDAMKIDIGFPVYASRTPIPAPTGSPTVTIASQGPWQMMLDLRDATSTRRAFPMGVKTAFIFSYQGPLPLPTDVNEWQFQGSRRAARRSAPEPGDPGGIVDLHHGVLGEPAPDAARSPRRSARTSLAASVVPQGEPPAVRP